MAPAVIQTTHNGTKNVPSCEQATYLIPDIKILDVLCEKDQIYEIVTITGFEIYIVEQWASDRRYSTVITSYTGGSEHGIKAGKITLPLDPNKRSDKMNYFFKEIDSYGGKPKMTESGILFITNLSKFPSNLNLLPVVGGCVMDVWDSFKVNLNLRKLNCGGRSALLLCSPSDVSEDKFRQIYKTHPKVDIMYSVEELVKLVQICLIDFKLLDPSFVDGLFCNQTEESILKWWSIYGEKYFGMTNPKDGKLGPTTVSALLGFVLSCTFRLNIAGCDIPKEPFNYFSFRVNAGKFQKQYNLERTWYLDPTTVDKLFKVTDKKADISTLKKVVKYAVHDLSKKLSTIQCAQEVLSTDLEKIIQYFTCSARLQYLWNGKGNVNNITRFNYTVESSHHNNQSPPITTSLRGKIKNLPKKLQDDSALKKKDKIFLAELPSPNQTDHEFSEYETEDEGNYNCPMINQNICLMEDQATDKAKEPICSNKKKTTFDCNEVFQNLNRRSSYPYLVSEVGINQFNYENHKISLVQPLSNEISIKRNKSFSFIEDSILKWDYESPNLIFLSKEFYSIEKQLFDTQNLNHSERFNPYRLQINKKSQLVKRLKHQVTPVFHRFELQKQEDERITTKIEDIEAIGARLEYEIRILQNKIRDTEDCVNTFASKVEALQTSIDEQLLTCSNPETNQMWFQTFLNKDGIVRSFIDNIESFTLFKWFQGSLNPTTLNETDNITNNDKTKTE